MPLVDDAHGRQNHAAAKIEPWLDEEIEISLLERQFALLLSAFDDGMLHLEFAPELNSFREAVAEQQNEAMKIGASRFTGVLVEVALHVAGDGKTRFAVG